MYSDGDDLNSRGSYFIDRIKYSVLSADVDSNNSTSQAQSPPYAQQLLTKGTLKSITVVRGAICVSVTVIRVAITSHDFQRGNSCFYSYLDSNVLNIYRMIEQTRARSSWTNSMEQELQGMHAFSCAVLYRIIASSALQVFCY
jgi:hypothetical protein